MPRLALLVLFSLTTLVACDPVAPGGESAHGGTHAIRLTGATVLSPSLDERPSGRALFSTVGIGLPGGQTVQRFVVELQDQGPDPFFLLDLSFESSAAPTAGTYAADAPEGGAAGKVHVSLTQSQSAPSYVEFFDGESGSVTITEATPSLIRGTLDVWVRTAGFSAPGGNAVRIQGTFSAVQGRL